jgi:putative transposase
LRKNAWKSEQKKVNYYDSKKMIPIWKHDNPELKNIHSQVLQEVVKRLYLSFKAFFRIVNAGEKSDYPKFKRTWKI